MLKLVFAPDLKQIIDVANFIISVHNENAFRIQMNYELCKKFARTSELIVKIVPFGYVTLGVLYQLPSIYKCIDIEECVPSMGVYLPGMSYFGNAGLAFQAIHNVIISLLDILIFTAFESLIYVVFWNILMLSTIIARELKYLKEILERHDTFEYEVKSRLIKLIQMHMKYNELVLYQISISVSISVIPNYIFITILYYHWQFKLFKLNCRIVYIFFSLFPKV